jgi:hypothetical protein
VCCQGLLDERESIEEKYRDYACMHHDFLVPESYAFTTWVWNGEESRWHSCQKKATTSLSPMWA